MAGIPLDSLELTDEDTGRMERERERSEYFCSFALETKPFLNREITSYAKVSLESPTFL